MAYNLNALQQQLQDLSRQYQQLTNQQSPIFPTQAPMPAQVPIPVPPRQVQYVQGMAGAKMYQDTMDFNSSEIIMDKDENIFYRVSKDANGTPSKRIIRAHFTIDEDDEAEPVFLTRKDLDDFKQEIREMLNSPKSSPESSKISQNKEAAK